MRIWMSSRLFNASLCQDSDRVTQSRRPAVRIQVRFRLSSLFFPCRCCTRATALGASVSESWVEGYCPVCGSWPAFAEVRGIERTRSFRCGRCGGSGMLACCLVRTAPSDHDALVALVPEKAGHMWHDRRVQACQATSRRLPGFGAARPDTVMLGMILPASTSMSPPSSRATRARQAQASRSKSL